MTWEMTHAERDRPAQTGSGPTAHVLSSAVRPDEMTARGPARTRLGHDFARIRVHDGVQADPAVEAQPTLSHGSMSHPAPMATTRSPLPPVRPVPGAVLQRCGATPCQGCSQDEDLPLMRQRAVASPGPSSLPPIVREALSASGRPLEPGVRSFFEPRFGRDFSAVRVHTDEQAARAADAIDASAFAVGSSIWFGRGMYQPQATFGRRLLAHELTHTIQQRGRAVAQRRLRVGDASDAAETAADRAADAVLAGEPMPQIGPGAPVVRRAPKVSPVPNDPSRRIVEMDDGSRYRVRRVVGLDQETITIPGEKPGPSLTPHLDKDNVWLQVDWCSAGKKADYRGRVSVGANLPAAAQAALRDIGQSIISGGDPVAALRKAEIKPFASVEIIKSERFSVALSGGPTIQPSAEKVTGGQLEATMKLPGLDVTARGEVSSSGWQVIGGIKIPIPFSRPPKVTCKRTYVVPKISYLCERIVPEQKVPIRVPALLRQTYYFYFEYAKPEFARRGRTAMLDAQGKAGLRQALDAGYRIETIRGYASPEGPVPPGPGFGGNEALSAARARAVEDWVRQAFPRSALSMRPRPSPFAEDYRRAGEGELYGAGPKGELKGRKLAEASVGAFETEPAEESRRTPDVMAELERRKTPERQTDTVWPLLRRAEVVVSKPGTQTRMVTLPESTTPMGKCPPEVIRAVADDFDREPAVKPRTGTAGSSPALE